MRALSISCVLMYSLFLLPLALSTIASRYTPHNHYQTDLYRLYNYLLKHYRRQVRPVLKAETPVMVKIYPYIYQIVAVFWLDQLLRWDPKDFGGIEHILIPAKEVWTPEISAYYSVMSNRMIEQYNDLRVNHTGGIRYFAPFAVENMCHIDVKYFPFDEQHCVFHFGPWAYRSTEQDWVLLTQQADQTDFFQHQEWHLESTRLRKRYLNYSYLGQELSYSSFELILTIRRESFFYVFNLVLPTAIIAFVSVIGFHMRSSSSHVRDAKFRLGIMTILSMTMLLLAVVDDMPKFSALPRGAPESRSAGTNGSGNSSPRDLEEKYPYSAVPLIGIYYFSLLAIIGCGTVTSSLFVTLERRVRHRDVPPYLRWLAVRPTEFIRGYKLAHTEEVPFVPDTYNRNSSSRKKRSDAIRKDNKNYEENLILARRYSMERRLSVPAKASPIAGFLTDFSRELTLSLLNIERCIIGIRHELYAFMPKNSISEEWLMIIDCLETFSFVFYILAITVVLLMFFFPSWY